MTTSQAVTFLLTALTWAPRADRRTLQSEFHQRRTKLFYPAIQFLWSCHITYPALLQASFHHLHLAQRELSNLVFTSSYANIIHNTRRVAFSYTATILVIAVGTVRGPPACEEKHSPTKVTGPRTGTTNCHQHQEAGVITSSWCIFLSKLQDLFVSLAEACAWSSWAAALAGVTCRQRAATTSSLRICNDSPNGHF